MYRQRTRGARREGTGGRERQAGPDRASLARPANPLVRVDLPGGLTLRRVETHAEFEACVAMQRATWGADFTECVPAAILMVAQQVGGVTAGAFEAGGQLAGFVFGMTGVRDGELAHWSDLLAVRADARDRGLGRLLKLFQRELLLPLGVRTMFWTFDPLVSKNAHLNLNRLGARPREYVVDMYGRRTGSDLHGATGTDRFIVGWDLIEGPPDEGALPAWVTPGKGAARSRGARRGHRGRVGRMPPTARGVELEAPIVNAPDETGWPRAMAFPDAAIVRVEIPADIHALQHDRIDLARAWRMATRRALSTYLERGYTIAALRRGAGNGDQAERRWYVLTHPRV